MGPWLKSRRRKETRAGADGSATGATPAPICCCVVRGTGDASEPHAVPSAPRAAPPQETHIRAVECRQLEAGSTEQEA